jgi:hypothetical protein
MTTATLMALDPDFERLFSRQIIAAVRKGKGMGSPHWNFFDSFVK